MSLTRISKSTIREVKEVEIIHDIKELEKRKANLLLEKELRIEEIDKQVADIDLILKTK